VLDADAIVFNRASTGIYFEDLLRKLDRVDGGRAEDHALSRRRAVMEHVRNGKGREIAFGAITEILLYKDKGLRFVGRCPPRCRITRRTFAALTPQGNASAAAREFTLFLATPQSKAAVRRRGRRIAGRTRKPRWRSSSPRSLNGYGRFKRRQVGDRAATMGAAIAATSAIAAPHTPGMGRRDMLQHADREHEQYHRHGSGDPSR
jgi:hypothetical protein